MSKKTILDRFSQDLANSPERVRKERVKIAQRFLDWCEGDLTTGKVLEWLQHLKKQDYAPGSLKNYYGVVKRLFDAASKVGEEDRIQAIQKVDPNNPSAVAQVLKIVSIPPLRWDLGKRATPEITEDDVLRVVLPPEEIELLVKIARDLTAMPVLSAFTTLSVIYGLRRGEFMAITPQDITKESIIIRTEKHGRRRKHLLPGEIQPYVHSYDFVPRLTISQTTRLWYDAERLAGIPRREGQGWHSVRRSVDTVLMRLVSIPEVRQFLRWKRSGALGMESLYFSMTDAENDKAVFAVHPFLKLYREQNDDK